MAEQILQMNSVPENRKEGQRRENPFGQFLTDEQFNKILEGTLPLLEASSVGYYLRFKRFEEAECQEAREAIHNGNFKAFIIEKLRAETKRANEFKESSGFQEQTQIAREGIQAFFEKLGVTMTENFNFNKIQYLGPYEKLVVSTYDEERVSVDNDYSGRFFLSLNLPVVFLSPEDMNGIDLFFGLNDANEGKKSEGCWEDEEYLADVRSCVSDLIKRVVNTNVHETLHAMSKKQVVVGERADIFREDDLDIGRTGFQSERHGTRRKVVLNYLNEGATEYFTRLIMKGAGSSLSESSYQSEMAAVSLLIKYLSGKKIGEEKKFSKEEVDYEPDPKQLALFLSQYTNQNGILSLGREMNEKIGPHALALFESQFFSFGDFLRSLYKFKNGEKRVPPVFFEKSRLEKNRISPEKMLEQYPFVTFDITDFQEKLIEAREDEGRGCVRDVNL